MLLMNVSRYKKMKNKKLKISERILCASIAFGASIFFAITYLFWLIVENGEEARDYIKMFFIIGLEAIKGEI